jgi:hypothetical protein
MASTTFDAATTTSATTPATTTSTGSAGSATARTLAKGGALAIGLAAVTNAVVYLVGDAGAPIEVVTGAEPDGTHLLLGSVVMASVIAAAIGTFALWAFERVRRNGFREWAVVAALVAVVSIPPVFRLDIDAGSKLSLSIMHLVVGAAAIAGHLVARRSAPATSGDN